MHVKGFSTTQTTPCAHNYSTRWGKSKKKNLRNEIHLNTVTIRTFGWKRPLQTGRWFMMAYGKENETKRNRKKTGALSFSLTEWTAVKFSFCDAHRLKSQWSRCICRVFYFPYWFTQKCELCDAVALSACMMRRGVRIALFPKAFRVSFPNHQLGMYCGVVMYAPFSSSRIMWLRPVAPFTCVWGFLSKPTGWDAWGVDYALTRILYLPSFCLPGSFNFLFSPHVSKSSKMECVLK